MDTPPDSDKLTCLMDIGPAVHQRAGLSRYTERLASIFLRDPSSGVSLVPLYNRHSGHQPPVSLQGAPSYSIPAGQYLWRLSVLASQGAHVPYRPVNAIIENLGDGDNQVMPVVYHATEHLLPFLTCPTVLTVHDLIFERLPHHHTRTNRIFLKLGMPWFVRNATTIIAVSHQTKLDLIARYSLSDDSIQVIYEGIDEEFTPVQETLGREIRAKYSCGNPYLLMVGSVEPRKNHIAAMKALEHLHASGYPHRLLIAGGRGWKYEPILDYAESSSVADRIEFLDYVPQRDLPGLYSAADCVLLPSYYEGFGFTALEAMACGTPVICSSVGSLPEVVGDAAIQVGPDDIPGLVQSIRNVLDQPRLAEMMVRMGLSNVSRFRWKTCAQETADSYRLAVSLHNR